jgi:L-threonylcarbamoyladenylate synthase
VLPLEAEAYAHGLFSALHRLDCEGLDWILVEEVPRTEEWLGVRDRLVRATAQPGSAGQDTHQR